MYYSRSGNTEKMAGHIADGALEEKNVEVDVKPVRDVQVEELLNADGIVIGSPTYYGSMASEIKKLLDDSIKFHGKLDGKVGGAFSSSGNIGGGNETTIMNILNAMLIHGMIVQGTPKGDHYGPVAIEEPDKRSQRLCQEYGQRIAKLVLKLAPA
ncbi:MAG: NAD(P)H-dependent oxidoreductase [Candidatus Bathyarchaeota archaeon]|nr:MAG: NAD(P)H-dependent oxidoreductase [Candidatus Bathyarchaeota archaeon]